MTADDLPRDIAEDLPRDTAEDLPRDTVEDLPRDTAEDLPRDTAPENTARTALRRAITECKAANVRRRRLESAEQLARELWTASERALLAFNDVDATIVEHRAEEFKRVATGSSLPAPNLPDGLAARLAMRDEALKQVTAAKITHENLVADLNQAEDTMQQARLNVAIAAFDVLMAEGAKQATALNAAWNEIWHQFDRLSALADCRLHYAETSFPITLPSETVSLLQTIAALDGRQFANGRNDAAANAGEVWCRWFKLLLTDAEAEVTFERTSL